MLSQIFHASGEFHSVYDRRHETSIHDELNKTSGGRKLMKKFSAFQIKNRIKYERHKIVQKFQMCL